MTLFEIPYGYSLVRVKDINNKYIKSVVEADEEGAAAASVGRDDADGG